MDNSDIDFEKLIEAAKDARERAYAPYSKFKVGAALLTDNDRIVVGCNVENASFGASNCAERSALFSAVGQGYKKFKAMVIVADLPNPITPCGICRQVLCEFGEDIAILCANTEGKRKLFSLKELLPYSFDFPQKQE